MPYAMTSHKAGKTIIVQKGYKSYLQAGVRRAKKEKPTKEAVKKVNLRNAVRALTVLLNENFQKGDLHLVCTYRKEDRPDADTAKEQIRKFFKDLRKRYRKAGMELKYAYKTEFANGAVHHHIVANYFDLREIAALWPHGMVRPTVIYSNDLSKLASYLVKEVAGAGGQHYVPSRNLTRPQQKKEIIYSKRWSKEPKPLAGYRIVKDSVENGENEITGFLSQYYIMEKIEAQSTERALCKKGGRKLWNEPCTSLGKLQGM